MPSGKNMRGRSQLAEIGFAEFTTQLITEVFNALNAANIRQTKTYIELTRATAQNLDDYIRKTKSQISPAEVTHYLGNLPLPDDAIDKDGKLKDEGAKTINDALELLPAANVTDNNRVAKKGDPFEGDGATTTDSIKKAAAMRLAASKYEMLQEMVRQGVLRLVVDHGVIETKLTFKTYQRSTFDPRYSRGVGLPDISEPSSSSSGLAGPLGGSSILEDIVGGLGMLRGSLRSAAGRVMDLAIKFPSESQRDVSGSQVSVFGRCEVHYKTDYLPLNP